jgi:cell division protein FtsB
MKPFYLHRLLLLAGGILGRRFLTMPAFGKNPGKLQELQRVKVIRKRSAFIFFVVLLLAAQVFFVSTVAAEEGGADAKTIERLERFIKEQQQQLESLQQQVNQLKKTATDAQTEAKEAKSVAEDIESRVDLSATAKAADVQAPGDKVVTSGGGERVKLSISGQVNRAVNIVDDGKSTDAYFVDNDNSESRVRFVGTARATDDLTLGSTIELTIAPNKAGEVNQNDEETGDVFEQRITEATLDSKRFGKLSLGKGHTASYGSASQDLSRTDVISYAEISDTAGGMLFRQNSDDTLTNVRIVDAFRAWNGLSRKNRVRYDSPKFYGAHLATSAISDQRYDAALYWGGQGYGFKAAGAAAFVYPNEDDSDFQYDGSFSLLHENTGLNLTLSAGLVERDNQGDAQNYYAKAGWRTNFFSFGETAFGVDYTRSMNLPTGRDDGYSVGAAAVQQFDKYGTEFYMLYRLHSLDRDVAPSVQDINVVSVGTRVRF